MLSPAAWYYDQVLLLIALVPMTAATARGEVSRRAMWIGIGAYLATWLDLAYMLARFQHAQAHIDGIAIAIGAFPCALLAYVAIYFFAVDEVASVPERARMHTAERNRTIAALNRDAAIPARSFAVGARASAPADAAALYRDARIRYWNAFVGKPAAAYYHRRLIEIYRQLVRPRSRVLELGCGSGDLLAALEPSPGVGVDFSSVLLGQAICRHPELQFIEGDAHEPGIKGKFDYIILSDLASELWDVQTVFERIAPVCTPSTRVIINSYSRLWEIPLAMTRRLGLATPVLGQNWLTRQDLGNMLTLGGFEVIREWQEILCPLGLPLAAALCNRSSRKSGRSATWRLRILSSPARCPSNHQPRPLRRW